MTTLKEVLETLLKATNDRPYVRQDGVHYTLYSLPTPTAEGVLNFQGRDRDLTRIDVDWVRAVLADLGYDITDEWLPVQGMSWLSNGVSAGVSFRIVTSS